MFQQFLKFILFTCEHLYAYLIYQASEMELGIQYKNWVLLQLIIQIV